jgi:CSLREA domain-containing protein
MTVRALRARVLVVVGAAVVGLVGAASARAVTFRVNTTGDPDNGVGSCLMPGGSCSLREAVNQSNMDGGSNLISLPLGTYTLDHTLGPLIFTAGATLAGGGVSGTSITGGGATQILSVVPPASVGIDFVTLENGSAGGGQGGAALVSAGASLTLTADLLSGNSASSGGAIEDQGTLDVQGSALRSNTTTGDGGAIHVDVSGTISGAATIENSDFSGNSAGQTGGAIRMQSSTTGSASTSLTVIGSSFAGNMAGTNGGAFEDSNGSGAESVSISDSTFEGNSALETGGGVYIGNGPTADSIINDTIAGNATTGLSGQGGDVGRGGGADPIFENTIVAGGSSLSGPDCFGTVQTAGHNLDSANGCGFVAAPTGFDLVNTAPDLGPLQDNGGPTETMALLPGSPAIDAGSNSGCPATDQRGVPRPQGPACDIGAYESAPPVIGTARASSVGTTTAILSAPVANPDPEGGTLLFQFGTSTAYGNSSATKSLAATMSAATFSVPLIDLTPNTVYHFRVVAENHSGPAVGPDATFTTAGPSTQLHPTQAVNTFTIGKALVSSSGSLTVVLGAPDAGHFSAKATFTVRKTAIAHHKGKRVVKHVKTTHTYGTGSGGSSAKSSVKLRIGLRGLAARELNRLGRANVTISITFTPTGGTSHKESTTVPVKRTRKGKYSRG